jgi:hypothetical protein
MNFARFVLKHDLEDERFWPELIFALCEQIKGTAKFMSFPSMGELPYSDGRGAPTLINALKKKYPRGVFSLGYLGTAEPNFSYRGLSGITTAGELVTGKVTIRQGAPDWKLHLHDVEWKIITSSRELINGICVQNYSEFWQKMNNAIEGIMRSKQQSADTAESLHVALCAISAMIGVKAEGSRA